MEEQYRTGGVAKSKIPGNKHVDVVKGYRLPHGYKAVKGEDKNKNYSKGKPKVKVDAGWRLPKGYKAVDAAYNMKYEDGGGLGFNQKMSASEFKYFIENAKGGDVFQLSHTVGEKDKEPVDCIVTSVRHKPDFKKISVSFRKIKGGAGVYHYNTDDSAEENYTREFKGGNRAFPLRLRRRTKGMSEYENGGMTSGYCYEIGGL